MNATTSISLGLLCIIAVQKYQKHLLRRQLRTAQACVRYARRNEVAAVGAASVTMDVLSSRVSAAAKEADEAIKPFEAPVSGGKVSDAAHEINHGIAVFQTAQLFHQLVIPGGLTLPPNPCKEV